MSLLEREDTVLPGGVLVESSTWSHTGAFVDPAIRFKTFDRLDR
jgi:hypothetical protein